MTQRWLPPLPLLLVPTHDADSFQRMQPGTTGLPLTPHPGAFGVKRTHHTHEGVDLYAPEGTPVHAVEAGVVVRIEWFTGAKAQSPWWSDTQAIFIEGASGVVVYGELLVDPSLSEGSLIQAGDVVGALVPVLCQDKGRPMTMLHLELHAPGTRQAPAWETDRPFSLRDPTPKLLECCL
jgi:hypothetical protein